MFLILCKKCGQFSHEEAKTNICHECSQDEAQLVESRQTWQRLVEGAKEDNET